MASNPVRLCAATSLVLLVGCSAAFSLARPGGGHYASLKMHGAPGAEPMGGYNKIHSVDGNTVTAPVDATIYVREGHRKIGYLCPGWITTDAFPRLDFDFEPDKAYVLDCTSKPKPTIHEASGN